MTIFEYISSMKDLGSYVSIAGLGILALFLVVIIWKMLGGIRKGTWNKLICVGSTLLAALVSIGIGSWLSNHIIGLLDAETFADLFKFAESQVPGLGAAMESAMSNFDGELIEYLLLVPATLFIIPVLTTVIFLILNTIVKIVRGIVTSIIGLGKARNMSQRLGGALLGAVEAIIWMTMVILPVCALLSLFNQGYQEAIEASEGEAKTELIETYDEYIAPFTSNPAIKFVSSLGTDHIANELATVKIEDEKANIREEVISIAHIIIADLNTLEGADFTALNEDQKTAVSSIIGSLGDSPILSRILIHGLHAVPAIYNNGLIDLELGGDFEGVLNDFLTFLETTSRDTIQDDLDTITDFYFGFCDSGILSALEDGQDIMQFVNDDYKGDRHLLGMINTLSGNPRTQSIVDGLYNFVLNAAFSGAMNNGGSGDAGNGELGEVIENIDIQDVKQGLNDVISVKKENYATEEEYKEELSNTIDTTIQETIGAELEDEVIDEIADFVDENFSDKVDELTDEEFNELIFEFIDIYQGFLNGEEINPDDFQDLIPD